MTGLNQQFSTILDHVPTAMLVIFRIGGLMIFGPLLSSVIIPMRVKLFLALVVGLAVYPTISTQIAVEVPVVLDVWSIGPLVFTEVLIGAAIGFMATLPLVAVQVGGLMMAHSIQVTGRGPGPQTLILDQIELNVEIDDAQFKMPEPTETETKKPSR